MQLFDDSYLSRFFIAFFVVVAAPYLISKFLPSLGSRSSWKSGKKEGLSALIRKEINRLGGRTHHQSSRSSLSPQSKSHAFGSGRTISVYEIKLKSLEDIEGVGKERHDLEKSVQLLKDAQRGNRSSFKDISLALKKITNTPFSEREVIRVIRLCLEENTFILSEERREIMKYSDLVNTILARAILDAFIKDAILESSTVCKSLERSKNKPSKIIYLSIRLLVLLKTGASKKSLYEMAIQKPEVIQTRFKNLSSQQLSRAMMATLRIGGGRYISPNQVSHIIETQMYDFEKFKKDFIARKSKEQERKRQESSKKKSSNKKSSKEKTSSSSSSYGHGKLDQYYEILGCTQSDSKETIKKIYRKLALKNHPDRVNSLDASSKSRAHEKFVKIQQAYDEVMKQR